MLGDVEPELPHLFGRARRCQQDVAAQRHPQRFGPGERCAVGCRVGAVVARAWRCRGATSASITRSAHCAMRLVVVDLALGAVDQPGGTEVGEPAVQGLRVTAEVVVGPVADAEHRVTHALPGWARRRLEPRARSRRRCRVGHRRRRCWSRSRRRAVRRDRRARRRPWSAARAGRVSPRHRSRTPRRCRSAMPTAPADRPRCASSSIRRSRRRSDVPGRSARPATRHGHGCQSHRARLELGLQRHGVDGVVGQRVDGEIVAVLVVPVERDEAVPTSTRSVTTAGSTARPRREVSSTAPPSVMLEPLGIIGVHLHERAAVQLFSLSTGRSWSWCATGVAGDRCSAPSGSRRRAVLGRPCAGAGGTRRAATASGTRGAGGGPTRRRTGPGSRRR